MCGCSSTTAFSNGVCAKPITCPAGKYNPGNNICSACSVNCSACTQFTGACTKCKVTLTLKSGNCNCLPTQAYVKNACTTLFNCTGGNYNVGDNTCKPCVANCASCVAFSGTCTKCAVGYLLVNNVCVPARLLQSSLCSKNCLKCDYSTGVCLQCA